MKNMKKLVALFAAATMALSMSVSAFADVVPTISTDKAMLNIGTGITTVNGDQTTMMAYVVPGIITDTKLAPDYTGAEGQEIVALDQVPGTGENAGIASVPVDPAKLADGNTIVVKISGTDGNLATYLITMEAAVTTYTVTYELAGGTVTNPGTSDGTNPSTFDADDTIAAFFTNVVAPAKVDTTGAYTYTFAGWATTADGTAIDTTSTELMTTLLADGAESITFYALYTETAVTPPADTIDFTYGDVTGDNKVEKADYNAVKVYVTKGSHPKYTDINTAAAEGYVYGDVTDDGKVEKADYNAIKVYVTKGSHPKYTNINTTVQVQP